MIIRKAQGFFLLSVLFFTLFIFRSEYSAYIRDFVRWLVGRLVGWLVRMSPYCFAPRKLAPGWRFLLFFLILFFFGHGPQGGLSPLITYGCLFCLSIRLYLPPLPPYCTTDRWAAGIEVISCHINHSTQMGYRQPTTIYAFTSSLIYPFSCFPLLFYWSWFRSIGPGDNVTAVALILSRCHLTLDQLLSHPRRWRAPPLPPRSLARQAALTLSNPGWERP
jgi:hypothetical protein